MYRLISDNSSFLSLENDTRDLIIVNNEIEEDLVHKVLKHSNYSSNYKVETKHINPLYDNIKDLIEDRIDVVELREMLLFDYKKYLFNMSINGRYDVRPDTRNVDFDVWANILSKEEHNTYRDVTENVLVYDMVCDSNPTPINILDTEIEDNINNYLNTVKYNNNIYKILEEVIKCTD